MKTRLTGLSAIFLLVGWVANVLGQSEPFSRTEAPFASPSMDGSIADWMAMRNEKNVLPMSFAHGQRDVADSEPLVINIQYAWDQERFYFLVEEVSDDDPSIGLDEDIWCGICQNTPAGSEPAPWNTDSVGFYDQGITWPANGMPDAALDPVATNILEMGPFTQFWVGLPDASEIVVDDVPQNYHITRIVGVGGGEGGLRVIGPRSEPLASFAPLLPDLPELTEVQSAHGIIEDGSNGGRGRRFTEAFMRWDQIRYPDPAKNPDLPDEWIDRIDELFIDLEGHFVEDIAEGYEFRLDPLLVDGLAEDRTFGSQTHPSGVFAPQVENGTTDWSQISVVRLTEAATIVLPGDCNADRALDAGDLACVTTIEDRDAVLTALNTLPGDLDGNGEVAFADFLVLSTNFNTALPAYTDGNIDLMGNIEFADFLVLSTNFNKTPTGAAASVPEPPGIAWLGLGVVFILMKRRR